MTQATAQTVGLVPQSRESQPRRLVSISLHVDVGRSVGMQAPLKIKVRFSCHHVGISSSSLQFKLAGQPAGDTVEVEENATGLQLASGERGCSYCALPHTVAAICLKAGLADNPASLKVVCAGKRVAPDATSLK